MNKLFLLLIFILPLSTLHTSAQSGSWQSFSGSDGDSQTILSESSFKLLKIEIKRTAGGSFDVDLQVVSDKQTYTERFLAQTEEFVIKASSIILIFNGDASGQYRITFYDSYPNAVLSSASSEYAFGILFGGSIFLILILFIGYISWRRS